MLAIQSIYIGSAVLLFSSLLCGQVMGQETFRFRMHTLDDRVAGVWAMQLLVPSGWTLKGSIDWTGSPPGKVSYSVVKDNGSASLEVQPSNENYIYTTDPYVASSLPQNIPPLSAVDYVKFMYLQKRGFGQHNMRIVDQRSFPDEARAFQQAQIELSRSSPCMTQLFAGATSNYDLGQVDIVYRMNGVDMFERIDASVLYNVGGYQMVSWSPLISASIRCPLKDKESVLRTLGIVKSSRKENPVWLNKVCEVILMMVRNQRKQVQNVMEASRYLSRTSDEIGDMITSSYKRREESMDRIFRKQSEATMGVDSYFDPYCDKQIHVPTQYGSVYTDGDSYIFSEQDINPNKHLQGDWRKLEKVR